MLKHPFQQAVAILVGAYLLIEFGIGFASAPVPNTVLFQYLLTVLVGVLLWVSADEERWTQFKEPIQRTLVAEDRRVARGVLLVLIPLLVAFIAYDRVRPSAEPPPSFRNPHPAPPSTIAFQGSTIELTGLENPLRGEGDLEEHYQEGKRVYYENCVACHGDALNGLGHYSHGFNPAPLNFRDVGTIAQLTESVVFWRIAKGGPGLPNLGTPWNSAMPAWEDFLTEDEIWSVIIFIYQQTGYSPRTWEEEEQGSEEEGQGGSN